MKQQDRPDFTKQLDLYRQVINADIAAYSAHIRSVTGTQYGPHSAAVTDAYLDLLQRGGKRIRGSLVIAGYEMCGGTDHTMIVRAATALEMMHAYILIIDDIQDRSKTRRGKPTVHEMLAAYHRKLKLAGDPEHTGISLALNAALSGNHAAQMLLAGLNVSDELRVKVVGIVNLTMSVTAHGQTADILNEQTGDHVRLDDIRHAFEWKTAHYTVLNPLCVGMVLAGAGCEDTNAIRDYALNVGRAFQITDDILGIFGTDDVTGKSSMDDIREGKGTLLTFYALNHAAPQDKKILQQALGNARLTPEVFVECQRIIRACGALEYAQNEARSYIAAGLESLEPHQSRWSEQGVLFLRGLAMTLLGRLN